MAEVQEGGSQAIPPALPRSGRCCLPSPYRAPASAAGPLLGGRSNPFPLIEDVERAHTLLPIAAFWFPVPDDELFLPPLHAIFSHETVHLILGETVASFLANCLVQGQFLVLADELWHQQRPRRWLALPSLAEPSGYFLRAQDALDAVGREMEFIHELMATTLVRVLFEHDLLLVAIPIMRQTQRYGRELGIGHLAGATDFAAASLQNTLGLIAVDRTTTDLADYVPLLDDEDSLAYYQDHFAGEGDFVAMHHRLLDAWRRLAVDLRPEGDDNSRALVRLLQRLVKYPFDLALSDDLLARFTLTGSRRDSLEPAAAFVGQLQGRLHARLELMLGALETVGTSQSAEGMRRHLSAILPNFAREFHGWRSLASFAYDAWGPGTNASLAFAHHFLAPYEVLWFNHAPLIDGVSLNAEQAEDRERQFNGISLISGLEAMRQAILVGQGPACICAPEMKDRCWARISFARLWFSTYPDPGWEASFRDHWRRPPCV